MLDCCVDAKDVNVEAIGELLVVVASDLEILMDVLVLLLIERIIEAEDDLQLANDIVLCVYVDSIWEWNMDIAYLYGKKKKGQ